MTRLITFFVLSFFLTNVGAAQVRSDFKTVDEYDNFLLRNHAHAFSGDSRPVFADEVEAIPFVNWWKILSESCANNERSLPDPIELDEKQLLAVYRSMDKIGRESEEERQEFLDKLENVSPDEAKAMSRDSSLFHQNVNIARLDNETRVKALAELFDKEQQRELRKIASARLHANVNLFALVNRLHREKELEFSAEELKRFRERLQEVNAELSVELTRLRAKAWDDALGALDRETREKLESRMLLNEIK